MATVPTSGTNIRLLSGVPFSSDYKNTRWFDTKSEQETYFLNKPVVHSMLQANFQRIEGYNFIAVNKSIDELWGTNYVMFQNSSYSSKWFYGFVTKLEYKQKNTTWVHFQIDVFQTWKFDMNFKPSFVVREHCKLWNSDGSPVINTVDEGLNYGTDYDTIKVEKYLPHDDVFFLVIVAKSTIHGDELSTNRITPTVNAIPQPLTYYVHPFKLSGEAIHVTVGQNVRQLPSLQLLLQHLYSYDESVNNIVSLYVTDHIGYNAEDVGNGTRYFGTDKFQLVSFGDVPDGQTPVYSSLYVKDIKSYEAKTHNFGNKYSGFYSVDESKLLMHPYTVTILDDFKGNRIEIKNEYIESQNLEVTVRGSLGLSNKVTYGVKNYLTVGLTETNRLIVSLEHSLINSNPNDIPIITDMLSAYLQGNRNSIENQKNSIVFNGYANMVSNGIAGVSAGFSKNVAGAATGGVGFVQGAGNTVLQLQGIEAKQQDINNIPPQLTKMGSNTHFDYGNGYTGIYVIKKQIKPEYRKKLTDFFKMFGYKVNEVKLPNFHTRRSWNFVQTSSCNITGNFNNEDLQELKSVFDNGITLWHTDDIGNYNLGNGVI